MAESQVPYPYTPEQVLAIRSSLSEPRFATYLEKAGNHPDYALALYLYNIRLAKAFLFPLSVVEVTVRNAVDGILIGLGGEEWHTNVPFRDSALHPNARAALDKAIEKTATNPSRGRVIAQLPFDFWSKLFNRDYGSLWRTKINIAFPGLAHGETREEMRRLIRPMNEFRNRVAHHEPVLDANVTDIHGRITRLVSLRCKQTAAWMKYHSTIGTVTRTRPKPEGVFVSLATKLDPGFVAATLEMSLMEVMGAASDRNPAIICQNSEGRAVAAFTPAEVGRYVAERAKELDGLVSLADLKVGEFLSHRKMAARWATMAESTALAEAIKQLQMPEIQVVVGTDPAGLPTGTLVRAHRRY